MLNLDRKVAVVTGAASGIGRALAERLVREGMKVVLADIDAPALGSAVDQLRAAGHEVIGVPTDVSRLDAMEELARRTIAAYGRVHLLCNNAGVTIHNGRAIWELTDNDWQWLLGVNFSGVVHGLRVFIPKMLLQEEEGHIVNTASMAGLVVGGGAYGALKHAVVSLSENLRIELERRKVPIGVTCLCPGLTATEIVESARHRPRDLTNEAAETAEQEAVRERIRGLTETKGGPPADVANAAVDGVLADRFYVITSDPPPFAPPDERIRLRMENILGRKNPLCL